MGGKSSGPATPNYEAIVRQQGIENRDTAKFNHELGKVGTTGPYGWTGWNGNNLVTGLSPAQQQNLDQTNWLGDYALHNSAGAVNAATQNVNMGNAPGLVGNVNSATGDAARNQAINAVYDQYRSKLDPMFQRQNTDLETSLINKGFDPNSAAYQEQVANASRNQADAYQQALNSAVLQGNETQNQQFMQALQNAGFQNSARNQYLDEILRQKSAAWGDVNNMAGLNQVQVPQGMQGAQGNAAPADYQGAAQNQYQAALDASNMRNAQSSNTWGLLGSLGGMLGAAWIASDARLKDNFQEVGQTTEGIPVWEYDIDGRRERGVIAQQVQQVKPDAVGKHPAGFLMVDYSKVGKF